MLGKDDKSWLPSIKYSNGTQRPPLPKENAKLRQYFPFKQGYLSVATLRVGAEGIQMTVDGKHITSFAFRDVMSLSLKLFSSFLLSPCCRKDAFCTYINFSGAFRV